MVQEIDIDLIDISKWNIRKDLTAGTEDADLSDLAQSIKEKGLINPITVRPSAHGRYELVAGQRRYLACKQLGLKRIRAVVREMSDLEALEISITEGLHQAKVNPIDKARAFSLLMEKYKDERIVASKVGCSTRTVVKYLDLLKLPEEIQREISTRKGPAQLETLSTLSRMFKSEEEMCEVFNQIREFDQSTQLRILKESGGDVKRIPELVATAIEGGFGVRMCRDFSECQFIEEEHKEKVLEMVKPYFTPEYRKRIELRRKIWGRKEKK